MIFDKGFQECPADLNFRGHLHHLKGIVLKAGYRVSEGCAALCIFHSNLQHLFRNVHGADADHQPLLLKILHQDMKPPSLFTEKIAPGHGAVLKNQLCRVLGVHPHFLQFSSLDKAGGVRGNQDETDSLVSGYGIRIGSDSNNDPVAVDSVGNKGLPSVDYIVLSFPAGGGPEGRQVRTAIRLGHTDGHDDVAGSTPGEDHLFLFLSAIFLEIGDDNICMDPNTGRNTCTRGPAKFFLHDYRVAEIGFRAPIRLWKTGAQESLFTHLVPHLARHSTLFFPSVDIRYYLSFNKPADATLKNTVVFGKPSSGHNVRLLDPSAIYP